MPPRRTDRVALPGFGVDGYLGSRGARVRADLRGKRIILTWTEAGQRKRRAWPDTPNNRKIAKAFGQGKVERLQRLADDLPIALAFEPRTLRGLWDAYILAQDHLRGRTKVNYRERWSQLEDFKGRTFDAGKLTRGHLDELRAELRKGEMAPNQIYHVIRTVKLVYRWAVDRDVIAPTKITGYSYKRSRDEQAQTVEAYSPAEAKAILAQFDPRDSRDWRGWAALYVAAFAGPRARAALHLEWRDIDLAAGTIRWRPELNKVGEDWTQPVPAPVLEALWVCYGWRLYFGYSGPFVFFAPGAGLLDTARGGVVTARSRDRAAGKDQQPWTYSAAHKRLRAAEDAARVAHRPQRAFHGFRRYVVTEVLAQTGNLVLAGQYVGDRDVRVLTKSYVRRRPEELDRAATAVADGLTPGLRVGPICNPTATADEGSDTPSEHGEEPQ